MLKFDLNFLFTIINLVIFYVLIRVFLFKPITKVMNKRKEMIENQFKDAEKANNDALELKSEYEGKIEDINTEAESLIDEAKKSAKTEYDRIMEKAEADAQSLMDNAKKQTETMCENERRVAREDIAKLAMQMAEKVIGANVSAQTDSDIFDEFLNESSDENESQN